MSVASAPVGTGTSPSMRLSVSDRPRRHGPRRLSTLDRFLPLSIALTMAARPVIELDRLFWLPGLAPCPGERWTPSSSAS
jgi:hypothetical protein